MTRPTPRVRRVRRAGASAGPLRRRRADVAQPDVARCSSGWTSTSRPPTSPLAALDALRRRALRPRSSPTSGCRAWTATRSSPRSGLATRRCRSSSRPATRRSTTPSGPCATARPGMLIKPFTGAEFADRGHERPRAGPDPPRRAPVPASSHRSSTASPSRSRPRSRRATSRPAITAGSSASLGERVATLLGLSEQERTTIRIGGYLHDVGKIAIADRILLKPGPLTDEEYARDAAPRRDRRRHRPDARGDGRRSPGSSATITSGSTARGYPIGWPATTSRSAPGSSPSPTPSAR